MELRALAQAIAQELRREWAQQRTREAALPLCPAPAPRAGRTGISLPMAADAEPPAYAQPLTGAAHNGPAGHPMAVPAPAAYPAPVLSALPVHAGTPPLGGASGQESGGVARVLAPRSAALAEGVTAHLTGLLPGVVLLFDGEAAPAGTCVTRHVLPRLECGHMAALAAGQAPTPRLEEVLGLLLAGVPVDVLEMAFHTHRQTAPAALWRLYEGYEAALADYGLKLLRVPAGRVRLRERLITAAMVEDAARAGAHTLAVDAAALITPLAAEQAQRLHVALEKL